MFGSRSRYSYTFKYPCAFFSIVMCEYVMITKQPTLKPAFVLIGRKAYYNNNCKTSIAPKSSKGIELTGAPSTGVGQTHSPGTMQSSPTMIRWQGNLGRISESEKVSFQMVTERNYAIWWLNMFREWIPKSSDSNWIILGYLDWLTLNYLF